MRAILSAGARRSSLAFAAIAVSALALAGCDEKGGDPTLQIGANPQLPEPRQFLLPPIRVAEAAAWGKDETPTVPNGLQVHALANGFEHPRSLYVLPNGDILVVEANGPEGAGLPAEGPHHRLGPILRRRQGQGRQSNYPAAPSRKMAVSSSARVFSTI